MIYLSKIEYRLFENDIVSQEVARTLVGTRFLTWADRSKLEFLLEKNDWRKQLRDIEVKDIEFFSSCGRRSEVERVLKFPV